jgi:hypothetical protein
MSLQETQQRQSGPIARHLIGMQTNEQQRQQGISNDQQPAGSRSVHRSPAPMKEVREWLNVVGVLLVPMVITAASLWLSLQQNQLAQQQHENDLALAQQQYVADRAVALDQQRETALKSCIDDLKDLLLNRGLQTSKPGAGVRIVARSGVLLTLQQLDGRRKAAVVRFLYEARLITHAAWKGGGNIRADDGDLLGATISLGGADLIEAGLSNAYLVNADLWDVHLEHADLTNARLEGADLEYTSLQSAHLAHAHLRNAHLGFAHLQGADLRGADLQGADLRGADLRGAFLEKGQLDHAGWLGGTMLPDGSRHP